MGRAFFGVCAGVVQLTYGSSIPDWTGDKLDTIGLGLATIALSLLAGIALWRLLRASAIWARVVCAAVALPCAVVCFTTVGRLWYLPGPLLIVATICAFFSAPAMRRADPDDHRLVTAAMLNDLPEPARRYLQHTGVVGSHWSRPSV